MLIFPADGEISPDKHFNSVLLPEPDSPTMPKIPPYTKVKSLDFDDHPFEIQTWDECCSICGSTKSYLDEIIINNEGEKNFICSDTDFCNSNLEKNK